jgi:hypothetical protein
MARRRVFKTRAECAGITTDLGLTSNRQQMIGRIVTLEKALESEVNIMLDGAIVGQLDSAVGNQVALALDRGQLFAAVIINAYPIYNDKFKQISAHIDIKVEYLLEKNQPPIEAPTFWRAIPSESSRAANSFFTKIAGVSHERRQQIIARCSVGESLRLVRDPTNRYDRGAIKVMRLNGEQLGFIPFDVSRADDPSGLAYAMDHGSKYECKIKDITGGGEKWLGVNIEITETTKKESYEELVQRRLLELKAEDQPSEVTSSKRSNLGWLVAVVLAVLLLAFIVRKK